MIYSNLTKVIPLFTARLLKKIIFLLYCCSTLYTIYSNIYEMKIEEMLESLSRKLN